MKNIISRQLPLGDIRMLLIFFSLLLSATCWSQPIFKHVNDIPVIVDGGELKYPWAGGLNNPQFSNADLNFDGVDDLFIFDRTNNKVINLLHTGVDNVVDYELTFEYEAAYPRLSSWALMRDFNCDGKMDIFENETGGIRVYQNMSTPSNASYLMQDNKLTSYFDLGADPFVTPIYVSIDIPAIDDIDGDGDLDIICFSQSGTTLQLFLNQAIEETGNCDSIAFTLANNCYGKINESLMDETLTIGEGFSCTLNVNNVIRAEESQDRNGMHAGSSICTYDSDQNGFKDVLIGDISGTSLKLVKIGPSSSGLDSAFQVIEQYPEDVYVNVDYFPTGYYVDINNDGVRDLMASPSSDVESDDIDCAYFYINNGQDDLVDFDYQGRNFFVDEMIDVGSGAFPHLVDYDSDGKMDLIVSNKGYYQPGGDYSSQLALYRNIGGASSPALFLIDLDYLNFSESEFGRYIYPDFGDLDNDGDEDMVLGDESGQLFYLENTAAPGQIMAFDNEVIEMETADNEFMDVGINATPQLFDLDQDGLLDLIVGERNPNINYFKNVGTPNSWEFELINDSLGEVIVDDDGDFLGYGVPQFFYDAGELQLVVGSDKGALYYYNNITDNLDGAFNLISTDGFDLRLSKRSAPVLGDLNNDGRTDMIVGNFSGGLDLYMGDVEDNVSEQSFEALIHIYPNPAASQLNIDLPIGASGELTIYDATGKIVLSESIKRTGWNLNIAGWSDGVYFATILVEDNWVRQKFVIHH